MPLAVSTIVRMIVDKIHEFLGSIICPLQNGKVPLEHLPEVHMVKNAYNRMEDPLESNNVAEGYVVVGG